MSSALRSIMNNQEKKLEHYNVPTYIEKAVKKLFKLKAHEKELALQIKDYMATHNIPIDTPLQLLKHIPQDEVDPNQMQLDFDNLK